MIRRWKRGIQIAFNDLRDRDATPLRISWGIAIGAFVLTMMVIRVLG